MSTKYNAADLFVQSVKLSNYILQRAAFSFVQKMLWWRSHSTLQTILSDRTSAFDSYGKIIQKLQVNRFCWVPSKKIVC